MPIFSTDQCELLTQTQSEFNEKSGVYGSNDGYDRFGNC